MSFSPWYRVLSFICDLFYEYFNIDINVCTCDSVAGEYTEGDDLDQHDVIAVYPGIAKFKGGFIFIPVLIGNLVAALLCNLSCFVPALFLWNVCMRTVDT